MNKNKRFFSKLIPMTLVCGSLFLICDVADAATRASARSTPTTRKNSTTTNTIKKDNNTATVTATTASTTTDVAQKTETAKEPVAVTKEEIIEPEIESETFFEEYEQRAPEIIISNKSNQFEDVVGAVIESAGEDNSFAEQIRRQRAALAASEASTSASNAQRNALSTNSHVCDVALRKCMMEICDKDFTKCALDGDTDFGDKLNKCRNGTECSAEEFSLFAKEIKSDRDMNVRLASYNAVIDCGNNYNACIVNECGTTYSKCLGKSGADAAIQKCSVIARECRESDSGLATRFGTAIGKLRENAEKDVKTDENRLYTLRELMRKSCQSMGAAFDERSFDCVYSIEFYAGSDQSTPMASRKAYAGDSFVCTQEWFGINTTTAKENAYRETRSQTAASSAMLGSGVGMAAGLISSGAINRAIDTQKAQKALKEECESQQGKAWKNNQCVDDDTGTKQQPEQTGNNSSKKKCKIANSSQIDEDTCTVLQCKDGYTPSKDKKSCIKNEKEKCDKSEYPNALTMTHDKDGKCMIATCKLGYHRNDDSSECEPTDAKQARDEKKEEKQDCKNRGGRYDKKGCYCNKEVMSEKQSCQNGQIKELTQEDIKTIINSDNPVSALQNITIEEAKEKEEKQKLTKDDDGATSILNGSISSTSSSTTLGLGDGTSMHSHLSSTNVPTTNVNMGNNTQSTNTYNVDEEAEEFKQNINQYLNQKSDTDVDTNWSPDLDEQEATEETAILQYEKQKNVCEKSGGDFSNGVCSCKSGFSPDTNGKCVRNKTKSAAATQKQNVEKTKEQKKVTTRIKQTNNEKTTAQRANNSAKLTDNGQKPYQIPQSEQDNTDAQNDETAVEVYDVVVIDDTQKAREITTSQTNNYTSTDVISSISIANVNDIDFSKDGFIYRGKGVNTCNKHSYRMTYQGLDINDSKIGCDNMSAGQWDVVFDYGKIVGTQKCSNKLLPESSIVSGLDHNGRKESYRVGDPGDTPGNYCYCKATTPMATNWVYQHLENYSDGRRQECAQECAGMCAKTFRESDVFRKAMFNKK